MQRRSWVASAVLAAVAVAALVYFLSFLTPGRGEGTPSPKETGDGTRTEAPRAPAPAPAEGLARREEKPEPAAETLGRLVVRVRGPGAKPVADAQVRVWVDESGEPREGRTDAEGAAHFSGIAAGTVDARADAEGFAGSEVEGVAIGAGEEASVELDLVSGTAFDGRVVDVRDGKGVANAGIVLGAYGSVGGFVSMSSTLPYERTRSDADGKFHVRGVPEGQVATIEATVEGYTKAMFSVRIVDGAVTPQPVLVKMTPGGRVVGVVTDPSGRPVASATVYVMRAWEENLRKNPRVRSWSSDGTNSQASTATTDAKGAYVVSGLPLDEEYVAVADSEGFSRSAEATGMRLHLQRLEAKADLALRKAAVLVVRLVDLEGRPVTDPAQVQVGEFIGGARKTAPDEGNAYRFEGLNVGEVPVSVALSSHRPAEQKAVLEPGATTELVVKLDPGASVEGLVVDEEGKPVADAKVWAGLASSNPRLPDLDAETYYFDNAREASTDAQGRFRIGGMDAGPTVVGAQKYPRLAGVDLRARDIVKVVAPGRDVRIVLVRLGSASIRLLTPDGSPYVGPAYVWNEKVGRFGRSGSGMQTKDGTFRLDGLGDGEIALDVVATGFAPVHRTFATSLRKHVDLGDVRLDPGIELVGRVVDLAGNPVAGAQVAAASSNDGVATDARGRFRLPHQPRGGAVRLSVQADGFLSADLEAQAGRDTPEIRLARGAFVKGVVRGPDGKPASDARLVAAPLTVEGKVVPDGDREWDAAKEDGRVEWRLPAGRWRISWGLGDGKEIPLGEWVFGEGDVRDLTLTLPKR